MIDRSTYVNEYTRDVEIKKTFLDSPFDIVYFMTINDIHHSYSIQIGSNIMTTTTLKRKVGPAAHDERR